jgi:hypothetical protein
MGLAAAVLLSAGSLAHAEPFYGGPPGPTCNPSFYTSNGNCLYGPNYCFRGPCLPPYPFNGLLPLPQQHLAPGVTPQLGGGFPAPPCPPALLFINHPFARSPRDYFMYGQTYNDLP